MKPCRTLIFNYAGWLLALGLLCLVAPRAYHKYLLRLPSAQADFRAHLQAEKKLRLATAWRDERPLIVMAGDSQIENGDWYNLFNGAFAIRNCGLATSKIKDVNGLISGLGGPHPWLVVFLCGVNDLGQQATDTAALDDYHELIAATQRQLQPRRIMVLSVMPVRATPIDQKARAFNARVVSFNEQLSALCAQQQVQFVNVQPAVMDERGGLGPAFTTDGLHLNEAGYQALAATMAPVLSEAIQSVTYGNK